MFGTLLATAGIEIFKDLISNNGEDLVKKGIEKVTGLKLDGKKSLTIEEVQLINDSKIEILKLDFEALKVEIESGSKDIATVNKTMQEEGKSEHWMTYTWRPFIGLSFGFYINSLWLLPIWNKIPIVLTVDTVLTIGAILGVASWHRGKMQEAKHKKGE